MSLVCDEKGIDNCGDGSDLEDHLPSGCKGHSGITPVQLPVQQAFRLSLAIITLLHSLYTFKGVGQSLSSHICLFVRSQVERKQELVLKKG